MSESPRRPPRPNQITVAGVGLIAGSGIEAVVCAVTTIIAIHDSVRYHELHVLSLLVPLVGILAGLLAVSGGVQLLLGRNKNLAYASAIASLIPGTLCCVAGGTFGILALVLLPRPETRAHFGQPVPPPTYWQPTAPFAPAQPDPGPGAGPAQPYPHLEPPASDAEPAGPTADPAAGIDGPAEPVVDLEYQT